MIEPVFGQIKGVRGFRQFLMRGLEKMQGEWTLVCLRVDPERCFVRRDRAVCVLTRKPKQANPQDSSIQAGGVRNAKEPIAAQIDLSG